MLCSRLKKKKQRRTTKQCRGSSQSHSRPIALNPFIVALPINFRLPPSSFSLHHQPSSPTSSRPPPRMWVPGLTSPATHSSEAGLASPVQRPPRWLSDRFCNSQILERAILFPERGGNIKLSHPPQFNGRRNQRTVASLTSNCSVDVEAPCIHFAFPIVFSISRSWTGNIRLISTTQCNGPPKQRADVSAAAAWTSNWGCVEVAWMYFSGQIHVPPSPQIK